MRLRLVSLRRLWSNGAGKNTSLRSGGARGGALAGISTVREKSSVGDQASARFESLLRRQIPRQQPPPENVQTD